MKRDSFFVGVICAFLAAGSTALADSSRQTYGDAMGWYLEAAEAGEPRAQFLLAMQYELGVRGAPNPEKAFHWYRQAAEGGYAQAQYKLGLLLSPKGDKGDFTKAANWFHQAAENGVAEAAFNYALMCEQGLGVEKNLNEAVVWHEKAAVGGQAKSAMSLATLYSRGVEGSPNRMKALAWLRIAEAMGESIPDPVATLFRLELPDEDVEKAKAFAEEWLGNQNLNARP